MAAGLLVTAGCGGEFEGGGDLRAQRIVLQREVDGLRALVQRLERGEPMLPADDVMIAVDDTLVRDLIVAQLPFDLDVNRFHLHLTGADVQFRGSPVVQLKGTIYAREQPTLVAEATVLGALEDIQVDPASSTLRAKVSADHLTISQTTGLTQYLSGATVDELARAARLQIKDQLPTVEIPVKVHQQIEVPAVTDGPVRLAGARMPLDVAVSQVTAVRGRLWIAVHLVPGAFEKVSDAPQVRDANAADAGVTLADAAGSTTTAAPSAKVAPGAKAVPRSGAVPAGKPATAAKSAPPTKRATPPPPAKKGRS